MNTPFSFAKRLFLRISLILVVFAFCAVTFAQKTTVDVEYNSYLAHIAAASNALQLHDTSGAKRWLAGAPAKFRNWEWRYLNAEVEESSAIFQVGTSSVLTLAVSPDGKSLLTASGDKAIRLLDANTGAEKFKVSDEKLSPQSLAFSPDGKHFAVAHSRHTVKIFETETGKEIRKLQGEGRGITAIGYSPDGKMLASCSWNYEEKRGVWGIVEIWNPETGESVKKLEYGIKPLVSIQFSPNGKWLAVGSWEVQETVAVWEVGNWENRFLLESEKDDSYKALQSIAFSPEQQIARGRRKRFSRQNLGC